jgi:hypothetical protein
MKPKKIENTANIINGVVKKKSPSWALLEYTLGPAAGAKKVKYKTITDYKVVNIAPIVAIIYPAAPEKLNCP